MGKPDHHRYYKLAVWLRRRALQLRSEPLCRYCLEVDGITRPADTVDHVEPHKGDWLKFLGPVQSLCKHHHDSLKAQVERQGYYDGFDIKGNPLDPNHPWYRGGRHPTPTTGGTSEPNDLDR